MIPKRYVRTRTFLLSCVFLRLFNGWPYLVQDDDFIDIFLFEDLYSLARMANYAHSNPVLMVIFKSLVGLSDDYCAHQSLNKFRKCTHCKYVLFKTKEKIKNYLPRDVSTLILSYARPLFLKNPK